MKGWHNALLLKSCTSLCDPLHSVRGTPNVTFICNIMSLHRIQEKSKLNVCVMSFTFYWDMAGTSMERTFTTTTGQPGHTLCWGLIQACSDKLGWWWWWWLRFSRMRIFTKRLTVSQGSVETLLRQGGKRLQYFVANLFRTLFASICQNRLSFVEDWQKHFGLFFSWTRCTLPYILLLIAAHLFYN